MLRLSDQGFHGVGLQGFVTRIRVWDQRFGAQG